MQFTGFLLWTRSFAQRDRCRPQQIHQQLVRETMRTGATSRDEKDGRAQPGDERKPLRIADIRDRTQHGTRECKKATSGIRTLDLRFTKARGDSASIEVTSTCNDENENTSSNASSCAQNGFVDPDLAAVIDAWPALSDPVKAAMMALVKAGLADE